MCVCLFQCIHFTLYVAFSFVVHVKIHKINTHLNRGKCATQEANRNIVKVFLFWTYLSCLASMFSVCTLCSHSNKLIHGNLRAQHQHTSHRLHSTQRIRKLECILPFHVYGLHWHRCSVFGSSILFMVFFCRLKKNQPTKLTSHFLWNFIYNIYV